MNQKNKSKLLKEETRPSIRLRNIEARISYYCTNPHLFELNI
jgi:hypothetical protein